MSIERVAHEVWLGVGRQLDDGPGEVVLNLLDVESAPGKHVALGIVARLRIGGEADGERVVRDRAKLAEQVHLHLGIVLHCIMSSGDGEMDKTKT